MIAVFVNPRSGACRRDPTIANRFAGIVGSAGRVLTPATFEALDAEARTLASNPPSVIAVHGGDGTLHRVLTSLLLAFGERPLPPLAILSGGTMNVVANSLGIRVPAETVLARLATSAARVQEGETIAPTAVLSRRCLKIGDRYGFVFGNGFIAHFLVEYYRSQGAGPARAVRMLSRLLPSTMIGGPLASRVFQAFRGRVVVDGQELPYGHLSAISAGTVREVGLRFKLNHRADDDLERFSVLAIHAEALALLRDVVPVYAGLGISPAHAYSAVASRMQIESVDLNAPYTIDGDLYQADGHDGAIDIAIGPKLAIVDPERLDVTT